MRRRSGKGGADRPRTRRSPAVRSRAAVRRPRGKAGRSSSGAEERKEGATAWARRPAGRHGRLLLLPLRPERPRRCQAAQKGEAQAPSGSWIALLVPFPPSVGCRLFVLTIAQDLLVEGVVDRWLPRVPLLVFLSCFRFCQGSHIEICCRSVVAVVCSEDSVELFLPFLSMCGSGSFVGMLPAQIRPDFF